MNESRLIDLFLRLAPIEALSQHEAPVAGFISDFLAGLGLQPYRDDSRGRTGSDTGNLLCRVGDGGEALFLAHMDTARSTAGVRAQVLDDRIVSDGSTVLGVDNRAGVALILHALETRLAGPRPGNFTVAFTVCEESTLAGSQALELDPRLRKCFIFDSSLPPGSFIVSGSGAKAFTVGVRGLASHSGLAPEKGINAIAVAARALARVEQGRVNEATTVNVGIFHGGTAVNVVSDTAELVGEVRSRDSAMVDETLFRIRSHFTREAHAAGAGFDFREQWDFRPYDIPADAAVYRDVTAALAAAGLEPKPVASLAGSDANSLNGRGLPAINLGIGAQNPHANDEFILRADFRRACALALELMERS
ncbi:MAG TPA: M20/M25/M40 family metallo-hydrolase [Candidatus Aminicenantes bacterium]|nr:M20/M25/M40 family metallo-hydrolase [Candidatus Aminicenantes bacterium]